VTGAEVEPLDPDSDAGREAARQLTALLLDIDERLAQEAAHDRLRSRD